MASDFTAGLLACLVSSLLFGSMFVPIKPFKTHDGLFVQWVMSAGILFVGLAINFFTSFPTFYPLAMLGGVLWATGNIMAVPIVNLIGMSMGMLLWGFTNCISGWGSGRFGWFGIKPQIPASDTLNYLGLALALISAVMLFFVDSKGSDLENSINDSTNNAVEEIDYRTTINLQENQNLLSSESDDNLLEEKGLKLHPPRVHKHRISATVSRSHFYKLIGVAMSLVSGVFYGLCFAPVIYIQDNYIGAPQTGLPYVFAHYCGVFLTCTTFFIIYCAYKQNKPTINNQTVIPAFIMGIIWAIAQASWFIANEKLSEAVSFPIITRFPGIICALWGTLYFKEIRGPRNIQILVWSIFITVLGGVLSGLSKIYEF